MTTRPAPRLLISAAHKSSGKTTVTVGLAAALTARGLAVQTFKKGPDYIDPLWLGAATGRACRNLDFHTQPPGLIRQTFEQDSKGADISLIEGNKGLYDGVDLEGANSSAMLAQWLDAPVVLVVDCQGMTRGIAPLLIGYQAFDPTLKIAGVILNKVSGPRHEKKLRDVVAHYTRIPILGAVHRGPDMEIMERHLGLVPANEAEAAAAAISRLAGAVSAQVDLDALIALAQAASPIESVVTPDKRSADPGPRGNTMAVLATPGSRLGAGMTDVGKVRIGIARDAAFGFYYRDDMESLEAAGAELVFFDATRDPHLPPNLDGLFIGGGFPETQAGALEANTSLRAEIQEKGLAGLPIYAECGGLMFLSRSIIWKGQRREMVGLIPADAVMHKAPQGRGYVRLRETEHFPWPRLEDGPGVLPAHEFHHSRLENMEGTPRFAYQVIRGTGIAEKHDGLIIANTLATYAHMRSVGANPWAPRFVSFVRGVKAGQH
ncbi:Cobyrinic acid A C-diamide synthase [Paramagnetospirillum magnetotacticum MS-1]|uniref:Cobyrinate a,c-diamide synthase n=1 Tax=Paramagnetospirillum magnetotacticum MS-1 TaxID=272627 RepID=A0A0C2YVV0_PARME|nr:cobyrinate a,c-diamide synthase [Paramagnetospirillum magnetotacticum]KIL99243.1 Cobyrinic acid A C-diamide synthase [Paramagnetospirillum magnetotacticum MS-1]